MKCTGRCGADARYLVSDGDTLLLLLCPGCWRNARQMYHGADARPLRRGA